MIKAANRGALSPVFVNYDFRFWIGALAGVSQAKNSTPEFGQGAAGFGRYYWHSFADQTNENLWVEFLLPVTARQDPRYYTLGRRTANGHNGPLKRAGYAVSRLFITRTDSGGNTFNVSEVGGSGAAAAISNLYYPVPERTWTKTYQRWLLNASLDGVTVVFGSSGQTLTTLSSMASSFQARNQLRGLQVVGGVLTAEWLEKSLNLRTTMNQNGPRKRATEQDGETDRPLRRCTS